MAKLDNDDFFDEALQTETAADNTQRVVAIFNEWQEKLAKQEMLSTELETVSAAINKIKTETMPSLLNEMGTSLWRDPDTGLTVELETAVNSKLPKDQDKRNLMFNALRPLGIDEILAEEFNVTFTPNDQRAGIIREILGLSIDEDVLEDEQSGTSNLANKFTNRQLDLLAQLREEFNLNDLPAEEKLGVHASRLKSWLKKQIDAGKGKEVLDAGIWHGKHAKVSQPKKGS